MTVNIGQAAKASGLSERMIRYFEKQGLIPAPARSGGGYRFYSDADVKRMRTIALAQDVGFPTEVIRQLLAMMDKAGAPDADSDRQVMAELDRKTAALTELRGRIGSAVEGATSRLSSVEPDIDWGSSKPAGANKARGIEIVTVRSGDRPRSVRRGAVVERRPEPDLTPAG